MGPQAQTVVSPQVDLILMMTLGHLAIAQGIKCNSAHSVNTDASKHLRPRPLFLHDHLLLLEALQIPRHSPTYLRRSLPCDLPLVPFNRSQLRYSLRHCHPLDIDKGSALVAHQRLGQFLAAQQTGALSPPNAPRGPFAPVPANQSLLTSFVSTNTGFSGFVPARESALHLITHAVRADRM